MPDSETLSDPSKETISAASLGAGPDAANLETALALAGSGISIFPVQGWLDGDQAKTPCRGVRWRHESTTDKTRIAKWWATWPDAAPAIDVGKSNLLVIDCDVPKAEGQMPGDVWWRDRLEEQDSLAIPVVNTPSGGRHYIFRQPDGEPLVNARGSLPAKAEVAIDVRGAGGYIVAGGAILSGGRTYKPEGSIAAAPVAPGWLVALLAPKSPPVEPAAPVTLPAAPVLPPSSDRARAWATAALESEFREVASLPPGSRNEGLNKASYKLGGLVGAGYITHSEAYSVMAGAVVGWTDQPKTLGTLRRGLQDGARAPRELPPEEGHQGAALAALIMSGDGRTASDPETGEVHNIARVDETAGGSLEAMFGDLLLPDPAAESEGAVRAITDWILATGRRPNAPLAMAAALVTVGGVCSRHIVGPTGSATHLFVACLGSSGVGKDHPLKAPGRVLSAAGLGGLVRTGKLMSSGALENLIAAHPAVVATIDEMGESLFGKIMHKRASTHEAGITAGLRELWSMLPGSSFDTAERAGGSSRRVESPALMLFGMSTPGEFFRPLDAGSAVNGFLNRFLLIEAGPRADDRDAPVSLFDPVPDSLVEGLAAILPSGGQLPGSQVLFASDSPAAADILQVPYANGHARALFAALEERCRAYRPGGSIVGDDDESPLLARTAEMSVRLATIHAMGRDGRAARVGEFDLRWGATIALRSAHAMAAGLERHSGGGEHADRVREFEAFLRREGAGGAVVPRRAVVRAFHRKYEIRHIDATLSGLKDAGRIEVTPLATGGRPSEGYRSNPKTASLGRRTRMAPGRNRDGRTEAKGRLPLSSFRRRFRP